MKRQDSADFGRDCSYAAIEHTLVQNAASDPRDLCTQSDRACWGRQVQGTERSERGWMTGWDFNAMSQGVRRASVGRVSIGSTGEHRKMNPDKFAGWGMWQVGVNGWLKEERRAL